MPLCFPHNVWFFNNNFHLVFMGSFGSSRNLLEERLRDKTNQRLRARLCEYTHIEKLQLQTYLEERTPNIGPKRLSFTYLWYKKRQQNISDTVTLTHVKALTFSNVHKYKSYQQSRPKICPRVQENGVRFKLVW